MSDSILIRAARLLRTRKYDQAIRLLEPEVVRYHDSFRYFQILALSCLYSGDSGGALTYFRRAREIQMRNPEILLGLAVLHLRRQESDKAIDLYLDILDKEPHNAPARKALDLVRRNADPEHLSAWIESGGLKRIYPSLPRIGAGWSTQKTLMLVGSVLALAALGALSAHRYQQVKLGAVRAGYAETMLETDAQKDPLSLEGSFRYVLTKSEALQTYQKARKLFADYRDDASRVELNRLRLSNASSSILAKATLLEGYLQIPGFDTLRDRFTYAQVVSEPELYRGVHVVFKGLCANLRQGERGTSFDLLVGYDTRSELEGIVPVIFDSSVSIDPEAVLEVLGSVEPLGSASSSPRVRLRGVSVHQRQKPLGTGR